MHLLYFFLVVFIASLFTYSCDSSLSPTDFDEAKPFVQNLTVSPSSISFNPVNDGQKDTTITFNISVQGLNFRDGNTPNYSVFVDDEDLPSFQGSLAISQPGNMFSGELQISTNTIKFATYTVVVTPALDGSNANYAQSIINQMGVPINAPEILEVGNPQEIEIPSGSATVTALFTAKVRDIDGQGNIDRVLLNFRNQDGSLLNSDPFELFDDGSASSGDQTPSDSVFTRTFSINSSNTPNNRTVIYWAIDKSGLSSDTLETPFNLVNNE